MNKYCLVSTTGDLASDGMSDKNTVIPFNDKYFPVVKEFLIKQEIWHISGLELYYDPEMKLQHIKDDFSEYEKAWHRLHEAGIFSHKYEARTEWRLVLNTEYELDFHKPYIIEKNTDREFYHKIEHDKKFAALHIAERFGIDFQEKHLSKHSVYGHYLFFKCNQKLIWDLEDRKIKVFAILLNNVSGEIYDEFSPKNFKWNNLNHYVKDFEQ